MKIAYVVTKVDPIGGVQVHLRDLAAAVQSQGHTVTLLTGGQGPFLDQLRARGIPTILLKHLTMPIDPLRDWRAFHELRRALSGLEPDLVALHSAKAGILGRLVARSLRIPAVLTAHGWTFSPGARSWQVPVYRRIERLAGPLATRIIAVSEFDRRLALSAGITTPDRIVTIYNALPDLPRQLRADPGRTPVRMIMVARFGPQKDHSTLLHALAGLRDREWELDLVGEGHLLQEMQALAAGLGLGERVRFLGQRMDVDQCLADAQISLLVTNWEGFPISILEAMRAGLPVIASAVGGNEESVQDGETGYLVPRGSVEVLRERIGRLLTASEQRIRLGRRGRERYEQDFGLEQMVSKTLTVYREVLTDPAGFYGRVHRAPQAVDLDHIPT